MVCLKVCHYKNAFTAIYKHLSLMQKPNTQLYIQKRNAFYMPESNSLQILNICLSSVYTLLHTEKGRAPSMKLRHYNLT